MAEGGSMDKAIYLRVPRQLQSRERGRRDVNQDLWYLIEEKSVTVVDDSYEAFFEAEKDMVGRFYFPNSQPFCFPSGIVVVDTDLYLIGWNASKEWSLRDYTEDDVGHEISYQVLTRDRRDEPSLSWQPRGTLMPRHQGGGAAVGPDGNIYTTGNGLYRFSPNGSFHERLVPPPGLKLDREQRLLGVTSRKLLFYIMEGGYHGANLMVSVDLESKQWDILDDYWSRGEWSAGVVLFGDRFLFSFSSQDPNAQEEPDVPGIYVFDIEQRQWLPEPVEGLPTNGRVLPFPSKPDVRGMPYSKFLLQIGNQDPNKLALLWDAPHTNPTTNNPQVSIFWSKFTVNRTTDQSPHFYVSSVSSGSCRLDDNTFGVLNCAAGNVSSVFHPCRICRYV